MDDELNEALKQYNFRFEGVAYYFGGDVLLYVAGLQENLPDSLSPREKYISHLAREQFKRDLRGAHREEMHDKIKVIK